MRALVFSFNDIPMAERSSILTVLKISMQATVDEICPNRYLYVQEEQEDKTVNLIKYHTLLGKMVYDAYPVKNSYEVEISDIMNRIAQSKIVEIGAALTKEVGAIPYVVTPPAHCGKVEFLSYLLALKYNERRYIYLKPEFIGDKEYKVVLTEGYEEESTLNLAGELSLVNNIDITLQESGVDAPTYVIRYDSENEVTIRKILQSYTEIDSYNVVNKAEITDFIDKASSIGSFKGAYYMERNNLLICVLDDESNESDKLRLKILKGIHIADVQMIVATNTVLETACTKEYLLQFDWIAKNKAMVIYNNLDV